MTPSLFRSVCRAREYITVLAVAALFATVATVTCTVRAAEAGPDCLSEITVTNGNDSGAGSLRQAIADVCSGGTIYFANDMTVTLTSPLDVAKSVTIDGQEKEVTVSGNRVTQVFAISHVAFTVVKLIQLTIADGWGDDLEGGAISSGGNLTVDSCLLTGNATHDRGGAIFSNGKLTVQNSTLTGNMAGDRGGAIYFTGSSLKLESDTITGNSATSGGGVSFPYVYDDTTANNTIIAAQLTGGNCDNEFSAGGNNLSGSTSCGAKFSKVDALLLGSLGDYGGDTDTIPLLPGSPAIDGGLNCAGGGFDQRGFPRFGTCDIGAFESQGFNVTVAEGNNQSTLLNATFPTPLDVNIAPKQPGEPVNGGQITFTAPASGASAALTGSPATISGDSAGGVTVTANDQCGTYNVTASARGTSTATFNLTNTGVTSYVVTSGADSGAGSLREGIAASCAGGKINFDGNRTIALTSRLVINKSLTIDGSGHRVTVDGGGATQLLETAGADVRLTHLTFANGRGDSGISSPAGIDVESGNLTITGCALIDNVTPEGLYSSIVFVSNTASTVTIINSSFSGNRSYSATILSMSTLGTQELLLIRQ